MRGYCTQTWRRRSLTDMDIQPLTMMWWRVVVDSCFLRPFARRTNVRYSDNGSSTVYSLTLQSYDRVLLTIRVSLIFLSKSPLVMDDVEWAVVIGWCPPRYRTCVDSIDTKSQWLRRRSDVLVGRFSGTDQFFFERTFLNFIRHVVWSLLYCSHSQQAIPFIFWVHPRLQVVDHELALSILLVVACEFAKCDSCIR